MLDRIPHAAVRDGEELDLPLGHHPLQQLIRPEGQVHPVGVRPDQDMVGLKHQVHRLGGKLLLFLQAQRGQALGDAARVDPVNERQPLQRMHAGQLGPQRAIGGKEGANARDLLVLWIARKGVWSDHFQLHKVLPRRSGATMLDSPQKASRNEVCAA